MQLDPEEITLRLSKKLNQTNKVDQMISMLLLVNNTYDTSLVCVPTICIPGFILRNTTIIYKIHKHFIYTQLDNLHIIETKDYWTKAMLRTVLTNTVRPLSLDMKWVLVDIADHLGLKIDFVKRTIKEKV